VFGYNSSNGNLGFFGGSSLDYGTYGEHGSSSNWGVLGSIYYGAYGYNSSGNSGFLGGGGVYGRHSNGNYGYHGGEMYGVSGGHNNGNYGWIAGADVALQGVNVISGTSVALAGPLHAGIFTGNVQIQGNLSASGSLSKGSGEFKIDHPLDPENKYLHHSFVESPDMMNIYNGNAILDEHGRAWVELPDWFGALNKDFRYQLTPVGAPGPDLFIAEEVSDNRFQIAGGPPGMKVSWQVTGIRQDAFANAHRIPVEEDKSGKERGKYLHAKAHGFPETMEIGYEARLKKKTELSSLNEGK